MRHAACCLCLIIILALALSCGSDSPSSPPAASNVTTEPAHAASRTVGLDGGTISTTASDGTKYTLDIPEGALANPRKITMTPVTAIKGLPVLKDAVVAGVDLQPSGLAFARPLRLTIETTKTPGAGELPIAIGYKGDAESFELELAGTDNGKIVVPIRHFSGVGVDFGTEENLHTAITQLASTSDALTCGNELGLVVDADPTDETGMQDVMQRWFDDTILPDINAATTDVELASALVDYNMWVSDAPLAFGVPFNVATVFAEQIDQARAAFIPKLKDAIEGNNTLCSQSHSLTALENVIFWQGWARFLEIDTVQNGLDGGTVSNALCAHMVIENASLPETMQAGFPHSLDFHVRLKFNDGTLVDLPAAISIIATNATVQNPTGNTDATGHYTTVITAVANGPVSVIITANPILPGTTTPSIIEGDFTVQTATGLDLSGVYLGDFRYFDGTSRDLNLQDATVQQTQNAITGTFHALDVDGTFSGTVFGQTNIGDASITVNGSTLDATATFSKDNGKVSLTFTAQGTFTVGGSSGTSLTLSLQGPNCAFTNLDVSGALTTSSHMFVFHSSTGLTDSVPITGSYSISAGTASFAFNGGGISGSFNGTTSGPGSGCSFVCMAGTLSICGFSHGANATLGLFNGEWEILLFQTGITCADGDQVTEIRGNFPLEDLFCK
ncbi:MAG TPA: hypothetical protein VJS69_00425 [Candidatus Krumholzibacteria bacterium]|nr:hypothetical protein [Candidatus Krumholzibacteria bacterium]